MTPDPVDPMTLDVATLAFMAGNAAAELIETRMHDAGHPDIRPSHSYLLQVLIGGEPTVGELAGTLHISQQAVSKSVRELDGLGYVTRRADPGDSRLHRVSMTAKGWSVVEASRAARAELASTLARLVDPDDIDATRRVLVAALEGLGALPAVEQRRVAAPSKRYDRLLSANR
jgi:DNA-binding MarR family transcriptional regulator